MDELRFDGSVALVTGAGRGIGRAHALFLATRGAKVVVNDPGVGLDGSGGDSGPAEQVAAEIRAAGGDAIADRNSVATPEGAEAMIAAAVDTFGRLDIVVNNAGIQIVLPFSDMDHDRFVAHLSVHVTGTYLVSRAAWPHLIASGAGRIVNTTSTGVLGIRGYTAYSAAKGGVIGLTRSLAVEGRQHGILVNAIAPLAATRMMHDGHAKLSGTTASEVDERRTAPGAEAVAAVAAYLAHERCSITGEVLHARADGVSRIVLAETPGLTGVAVSPELVAAELTRILDDSSVETLPDALTLRDRRARAAP